MRTAEVTKNGVMEKRAEERVAGEEDRGRHDEAPEREQMHGGGAGAGARGPRAERHQARQRLTKHAHERGALAGDLALREYPMEYYTCTSVLTNKKPTQSWTSLILDISDNGDESSRVMGLTKVLTIGNAFLGLYNGFHLMMALRFIRVCSKSVGFEWFLNLQKVSMFCSS